MAQTQVDERDVRADLTCEVDRLGAAHGGSHDQVAGIGNQGLQLHEDQRLVLDEQKPHGHRQS